MRLQYLPYVPSRFEDFLLAGRHIRADVHEWLCCTPAERITAELKSDRWQKFSTHALKLRRALVQAALAASPGPGFTGQGE